MFMIASRDRMRQVFKDVPVIYGFSSAAPLGPVAAAALNRYFQANGVREIGQGRPGARLLAQFAPYAMSAAPGMTDKDPHADVRRDVCQFADDRLSDAQRLGFVHELLQREMAQARIHLDRIQRVAAALDDEDRQTPEVARALADIAGDSAARTRFLEFARDADQPAVRARMFELARELGWLSVFELKAELAQMLDEVQARRTIGLNEVNLACTLNQAHELDDPFNRLVTPADLHDDVPHAAFRACLGSPESRARTLAGLVSPREADVQIAQAYLRHRPITESAELRRVAADIVRMPASEAQVRALEALRVARGRLQASGDGRVDRAVERLEDHRTTGPRLLRLVQVANTPSSALGSTRDKPDAAYCHEIFKALARHYVSDRDIVGMLIRLFSDTPSSAVQGAIAGILIRADRRSIASPELVRTLVEKRHPSPSGDSMIDALIGRLQSP